jgi:dienelactone hydrolase
MAYDPFERGPYPAGVRSAVLTDAARDRVLPVEVWYPATDAWAGRDLGDPTRDRYELMPGLPEVTQDAVRDATPRIGRWPLVVFSHGYGGHRRQSTFLCTHLASHGYVVVAADHTGNTVSDVLAAVLAAQTGAPVPESRAVLREFAVKRPADAVFLIDQVLSGAGDLAPFVDPQRIAIAGHSFGGWTSLVTTAREPRIRAALPLAPAGGRASAPAQVLVDAVEVDWERSVPTLFVVADGDCLLPLDGMRELYGRVRPPKRLVVLENTDHLHFMDRVEENHEMFRTMPQPALFEREVARMRPAAELLPGEHACAAVRALGLAHFDDVLKDVGPARDFLAADLRGRLAARGIPASIA